MLRPPHPAFPVIPRPDLLDAHSPAGLEVFQLTDDRVPHCHVYMDAQVFTPDSARLVLHRSAHAHGSHPADPEHRFLLCDLANGGALTPLTSEVGATAPCVSPCGTWLWYFVDETKVGGGRLSLRRVPLSGGEPETALVLDAPLPETKGRPSLIDFVSTIRSDGLRIALTAFFGDGKAEGAPWGLMVFNLEDGSVSVPLQGPHMGDLHPQYRRSTDPEAMRDLLVQENHGNCYFPDGSTRSRCAAAWDTEAKGVPRPLAAKRGLNPIRNFTGFGPDAHVVRDDGTLLRSLPWGRDGNETCQGHQCWRGNTDWAITSTLNEQPEAQYLIESRAIEADRVHEGARLREGTRNRLCRALESSAFFHFATDAAGRFLVTDRGRLLSATEIWLARLGETGQDPAAWARLLDTRGPVAKQTQLHPFLSPDGRAAFFNSAENGVLHAYMVRGLERVTAFA
jgi:hypothetical protein